MRNTSVHERIVVVSLRFALAASGLSACGDDGGGGDTASLLDQSIALNQEQVMLECECQPGPCDFGLSTPSGEELDCIKSVVAKYASQIGPELRCAVNRSKAQNECYATTDCNDYAAWEACYDAGGDCDDSFTESVEDEFRTCEENAGGETSEDMPTAGSGAPRDAGGELVSGTECTTDADCVLCDVTVLNGMVQCCMPCGTVTSAAQCEVDQALLGQCAVVSCPAIACAEMPVPSCISGVCGVRPRV